MYSLNPLQHTARCQYSIVFIEGEQPLQIFRVQRKKPSNTVFHCRHYFGQGFHAWPLTHISHNIWESRPHLISVLLLVSVFLLWAWHIQILKTVHIWSAFWSVFSRWGTIPHTDSEIMAHFVSILISVFMLWHKLHNTDSEIMTHIVSILISVFMLGD